MAAPLVVAAGMESSDSEEDDLVYSFASAKSRSDSNDTTSAASLEYTPSNEVTNNHNVSSTPVHAEHLNGHAIPVPEETPTYKCTTTPTTNHVQNNYVRRRRQVPPQSAAILDEMRVAIIQGNLSYVRSKIENNEIFVDAVLKSGWTALMYACSFGNPQMVHYLLEKNADPNYHSDKFTSLMAACASRKDSEEDLLKCVDFLIEFGAKVNAWERHLVTPLMFAAREGRPQIVKKLLNSGADVNRQDNRGWTALFYAAQRGYGQVVRILLDGGADPSKISTSGQLAAELAMSQGYTIIGEILEKVAKDECRKLTEAEGDKLQKMRRPSQSGGILPGNNHVLQKGCKKLYTRYGDLELFLSGLNLSNLIPLFQEHEISFHDFLLLTEDDLEKMGVDKLGVRRKILDGIQNVHRKEWEKCSLPDLKAKQYISCPDAVAMMANIAKHLSYIESSVKYLRIQIQAHPRILELGQEVSNVKSLGKEIQESMKNVKILFDELRFFKMHIDKVQDNAEYIPADLIVELVPEKDKLKTAWSTKKKLTLFLVGAAVMVTVTSKVWWKKPESILRLLHFPKQWQIF